MRTTPWPVVPARVPLILIADALVLRIRKRWYTVYCVLLRRSAGGRAVVLPLVILPGVETPAGWNEALGRLGVSEISRIRALVCDGHRGLTSWAKAHALVIQRCHFHLLAAIQHRRNRWSRTENRAEGERVHALVVEALTTTDGERLHSLLQAIDDEAFSTRSPHLRKILRGFTTSYEDFRSYLYHPNLHLPTTSNTAESFIGLVREMRHRARGFSSEASFSRWLEALVKHRGSIACNGFSQQN